MYKSAVEVIKQLQDFGYEALLAGGCVRDWFMDRTPSDYDIATNATPDEVEAIFKDTVPLGKAFGVIQVKQNEHVFEVATFRKDSASADGRHPDNVEFTSMKEDASRRDFTINAMFYDPLSAKVHDFNGGLNDIRNKKIRFIGNPHLRIEEDNLRILRALRFAVTLGFRIEPKSWEAVKEHAASVVSVSQERISAELRKMFLANPHKALGILCQSGLLEHVLPEVALLKGVEQPLKYHPEGDVMTHTHNALDHVCGGSEELIWATLLHDIGKPDTKTGSGDDIHFIGHDIEGEKLAGKILARMKFPTKFIAKVKWMIKSHMRLHFALDMRVSKVKKLLSEEHIEDLLLLHQADCLGSDGSITSYEFLRDYQDNVPDQEINPKRLVTGHDIIALGFKPGILLRTILDHAEEMQLEDHTATKESIMNSIKERYYGKE